MNAEQTPNKNILFWTFLISLIALIIRLIFLWQASNQLLFAIPLMDMEYHHQWARALLSGAGFVDGPFFRAPLYPYFLGLVYYLFGSGFWPTALIQAFLGALSGGLVYLIGQKAFNRRTGIIAGLIFAFYGTLVFYTGLKLIPTLAIFLTLGSFYTMMLWFDQRKLHLILIAGLLMGMSAIARPTVLLFVFAFALWMVWRSYCKRESLIKPAVLFLIGVILPILPVTAHNWSKSGELIPIGTYAGMNFYIGNNAQSDGISARLPNARKDWWGMMEDAERMAIQESGRNLSESEQSSFWLRKGLGEIADHPLFFIKNTLKRSVLLFEGIELSNNFDFYFFAREVPILKVLIWSRGVYFPFGILMPLAVMGLLLGVRQSDKTLTLALFLAAYVPTIILFFVTARYRLPLVPFLIIFAAYAITRLPETIRSFKRKKSMALLLLLIGLLVFCNLDLYNTAPNNKAQGYYTLAALQDRQGHTADSEQSYRLTLREDPTFAEAYNDLGLMVARRGDLDQATSLLKRGSELDPNNYVLAYNLAYIYLLANRPDAAVEPLENVLRIVPDYTEARNNLGLAYMRLQVYDRALDEFGRLTQSAPDFADGWYNIGVCYMNLDQTDSARTYLQEYLSREQSNPDRIAEAQRLLESLGD